MLKKYSDFKIMSIILMAVLIFFTVHYFRLLPLDIFNIDINDYNNYFQTFYIFLTELIAVLLAAIFVLVYSKKTDKELKNRYKSIGIGIGVILFYFIFPYFQIIPFRIFNADPSYLPYELEIIYLVAYYCLTASIICLIYNKIISKDWKKFKKDATAYFNKNLKIYLISLGVIVFSNLIIQTLFSTGIANNEKAIRDSLATEPFYMFFSAVIFAPIVEELVFRVSVRKIFSNKWVFIIFSGLFFGMLHVITNYNQLSDLLFIIPYSAPGIAFAYMLEKNDNIIVPMSFHLINNGIMVSLLILISIFI